MAQLTDVPTDTKRKVAVTKRQPFVVLTSTGDECMRWSIM